MAATTIYDALRESHEVQRAVFRKLLRSKPGSQERMDLFTQARHELAAHEAAEERYLYVPIPSRRPGHGSTRVSGARAPIPRRSGGEGGGWIALLLGAILAFAWPFARLLPVGGPGTVRLSRRRFALAAPGVKILVTPARPDPQRSVVRVHAAGT